MEMGWTMHSIKMVGIRSKSILPLSLLHRPPGTSPGQVTHVSPQEPRIGMRDKLGINPKTGAVGLACLRVMSLGQGSPFLRTHLKPSLVVSLRRAGI